MVRETSIEIYRQIEEEGLLSKLRFLCYKALFYHGPLTAMEVCAQLHKQGDKIKQVSVSPRMSELRDRGVAKEVGEKICSITGNNSILRDCTADLPRGISKSHTKESKKQIIERLQKEIFRKDKQIEHLKKELYLATTGQESLL